MKRLLFVLLLVGQIMVSTQVMAQYLDKLAINGFGGWAYGKTNGNHYLVGCKDGGYSHFNFALNITAKPNDKFGVNAQFSWKQLHSDQWKAEVNYAFAEWNISGLLQFRIGKVKQPFGIYSEIYDVGTLRPFFELPQSVYGLPGFGSKSYNGVGFTGSKLTESGWGLQYDIYAGEVYLQDLSAAFTTPESPYLTDVIGLRIISYTPLESINLGISSYTGELVCEDLDGAFIIGSAHLEILTEKWLVHGEYAEVEQDKLHIDAAYLETGYKVTENWQIVGRYDWSDMSFHELVFPISSLAEHKEWAVGVNYWFNPGFVLKLSYHKVDGNRFAGPLNLEEALMRGALDEETKLLLLGTQFSF